jgi:hypothetical protein
MEKCPDPDEHPGYETVYTMYENYSHNKGLASTILSVQRNVHQF